MNEKRRIKAEQIFIQKAMIRHKNKFGYHKVYYKNYRTNIIITCPKHGDFNQMPTNHLKIDGPRGCKKCSHERLSEKSRMSFDEFFEKAEKIHGDLYDYSEVRIINARTKVNIICKKCDKIFQQTPGAHLVGKGCSKCGTLTMIKKQSSNTEEFIKKAKKIHGDLYDYSDSIYTSFKKELIIKCKLHGKFNQTPDIHLSNKSGCRKCGEGRSADSKRMSFDQFKKKAIEAHSDRYNYDKVIYKNADTKVKIICHLHGQFEQTPDKHINRGDGCPNCKYTPQSKEAVKIIFELKSIFEKMEPREFLLDLGRRKWNIDMYIPELKLCIEYDGSYYHEGENRIKADTLKSKEIINAGYELIRIREEPLEKINTLDILSKKPYKCKKIVNDIFKIILKKWDLEKSLRLKIKDYIGQKELNDQCGANNYLNQIALDKIERKAKKEND